MCVLCLCVFYINILDVCVCLFVSTSILRTQRRKENDECLESDHSVHHTTKMSPARGIGSQCAARDNVRVVPYFVHPDTRRGVLLVLRACAPPRTRREGRRHGSQSSHDQASPWLSSLCVCVRVERRAGSRGDAQIKSECFLQSQKQPKLILRACGSAWCVLFKQPPP